MNKILPFLFLALALFGFLHQGLACHSWWDWGQVWHHEVLIIGCLCVALGIFVGLILRCKK